MIDDIAAFVSKMRVEAESEPKNYMAQRWCYCMEQAQRERNMKILRLVVYDDMHEGMTIPLAQLITKVLPVEFAASPYGIGDDITKKLKEFAGVLIDSGKSQGIRLGMEILRLIHEDKNDRERRQKN